MADTPEERPPFVRTDAQTAREAADRRALLSDD
jgi:hypothetical protein